MFETDVITYNFVFELTVEILDYKYMNRTYMRLLILKRTFQVASQICVYPGLRVVNQCCHTG